MLYGITGCASSPEDTCENECEWHNRCESSDERFDCDEDGEFVKECVHHYQGLTEGCQNAWDNLFDCLEDSDSCGKRAELCPSESDEWTKQCVVPDEPPI